MKVVSDFRGAFEKVGEQCDSTEANLLLRFPCITMAEWLLQRASQKSSYIY